MLSNKKKKYTLKGLLLFFLFSFCFSVGQTKKGDEKAPLLFTENKGQVADQYDAPRPDILFGGKSGDLAFHLKKNGLSYQLEKVIQWKKDELFEQLSIPTAEAKNKMIAEKTLVQRIDILWKNCDQNAVISKENPSESYSNYYLPVCPDGVRDVRSYRSLTYHNIYKGVDLKWYSLNGKLKYDFILSAGADPSQIQLEIKGAKKISVNKKGELIIETPVGNIIEERPIASQNGKYISCEWKIKNNIVSYSIPSFDSRYPLLIDPGVRLWGTYYGGNQADVGWGVATDASGNVYHCGYANTQGGTVIATSGAHQTTHGGGLENAFLAKFNSSGARIWATYYGGSVRDLGVFCSVDPNNNIYMSGHTLSGNPGAIATPGSHQSSPGGDWDAYLVKFNSAGVRQWGTYYGGPTIEFGVSCAAAIDGSGDVYLTGKTQEPSGNVIATPGSHQSVFGGQEDAFLVKFNSAGVRQWGTYYGLEGTDQGNHVATDASGYVYFLGNTSSTAGIASPGAYQTNYVLDFDAFIAKFNNSGVRQWGTYYGGNGDDRAHGFARDVSNGSLYVCGRTSSSNSIATDGSYQPNFAGGNWDGFLVKLNANGSMRDWGTYYGGAGEDLAFSCSISNAGSPYIVGYAGTTSTALATPGSHQPNHAGGLQDAFIAQFNSLGSRIWASYYGGNGFDTGHGSCTDNNSNVYLCGQADAAGVNVISTAGTHQTSFGGGGADAYVVKFYDCSTPPAPTNISPIATRKICLGSNSTLSVTSIGSVNWYTVPSGGSSIASGSVFPTGTLALGTYSFFAEATTCTNSIARVPITVTVHPLPTVSISTSNTLLCLGSSCSLLAGGALTYSWNTGALSNSISITPTLTTTFTVIGTDVNSCSSSAVFTQSVTVCTYLQSETAYSSIQIFPSPFSERCNVSGLVQGQVLTLYNSIGQVVKKACSGGNTMSFFTGELSSGLYILNIQGDSSSLSFRLLKE